MVELKVGGRYQHYKGQEYRVLGTVKHSETLEDLVLYECLYENPKGKLWVRPFKMFLETVSHQGMTVPRFKFISLDD